VAGVTFASDEQGSTFKRCVDANRRVLQLMALYFHASARRKLRSDRVVDGAALSRASTSASNGRQRGNPLYLAVLIGRTKSTLNYAISRLFAHRHFLSLCLSALIAV
jgi:hypothetical protein